MATYKDLVGSYVNKTGAKLRIKSMISTRVVEFPALPLAVSGISAIAAFFIARKEKTTGREINSQSLIANAQESCLVIFN